MITFIYWCVNANGVKTSFQSTAFLEIGMEIPVEDGVSARIIEIDVVKEKYSARDYAEAYNLIK